MIENNIELPFESKIEQIGKDHAKRILILGTIFLVCHISISIYFNLKWAYGVAKGLDVIIFAWLVSTLIQYYKLQKEDWYCQAKQLKCRNTLIKFLFIIVLLTYLCEGVAWWKGDSIFNPSLAFPVMLVSITFPINIRLYQHYMLFHTVAGVVTVDCKAIEKYTQHYQFLFKRIEYIALNYKQITEYELDRTQNIKRKQTSFPFKRIYLNSKEDANQLAQFLDENGVIRIEENIR